MIGDVASWNLVVWDMPYEVYRTFTCNLTLTKLYNVLLTPRLLRDIEVMMLA